MGGVGEGALPDVLQIDAFADVKRTHVRSNAAMRQLNENGCRLQERVRMSCERGEKRTCQSRQQCKTAETAAARQRCKRA